MQKIILFLVFLYSTIVLSQNDQLAQNYYDRGEFEKALLSYEELLKVQQGNSIYFQRIIDCHQQLLQFDKAEKAIQERLDKYRMASMYVELGYN